MMLSIPIENKMLSKGNWDVVYSYREIRSNGGEKYAATEGKFWGILQSFFTLNFSKFVF